MIPENDVKKPRVGILGMGPHGLGDGQQDA